MKRYGFIGVGDQGGPIAKRMIQAGLPVVIYARRPEVRQQFSQAGAYSVVDSVEAFAREVDYVGICVVDDAGVKSVCEVLLDVMMPGSHIVIHSTVSPRLCDQLAAQAQSRGITLLDAPVSGGGQSAAEGTLAIMVGGEAAAFERIRPVLRTFGNRIFHLGGVGAGQKAKLVNNATMMANLAIAFHAITAAKELAIDHSTFIELVKASSGHSFAFDVAARMDVPDDFAHGAALLAKDVALLGDAMAQGDAYLPIRDAARSFFALMKDC